ncbi:MAG: hypothetical protein RL160_1654 [Bacteroidota bacterium]|jgi:hypothetical protein
MLNSIFFRLFLLVLLGSSPILATSSPLDTLSKARSLRVVFTQEPVRLDGILDEAVWANHRNAAAHFIQHFPYDTSRSSTQTEVMLANDEHHLYVAVICRDAQPEKPYVIQSLKRDYSFPVSDAVNMVLDPWNDGQNGFSFGVNPMGAQREGSVENGGNFGVTTAWDQVWYSEVKRYQDHWVSEWKIPFRSLRFPAGVKQWKVNFARNNLKMNETSTWVLVPRNFNVANLTFTGIMEFQRPPQSRKTLNAVLIPYAISRINRDFLRNKPSEVQWNGGADAKIAISSGLNLDLTINPDFAQVDVDVQQINLSRFSLFFPERRQFFIENSDLFGSFGFRQIRPFFSRNIGLDQGRVIPIRAGLRLSGKIGTDWRIGAMSVQTAPYAGGTNTTNYSVATVQRKVFSSSNISAIVVNRQGFAGGRTDVGNFNRIIGLDYNLISKNSRWRGKAFYHHSFYKGSTVRNSANALWLQYAEPRFFVEWNHEYVHSGYRADVGFVPRTSVYDAASRRLLRMSYLRLEPIATKTWYPGKGPFNNIKLNFYNSSYLDSSFQGNDVYSEIGPQFTFRNTMSLSSGFIRQFIRLYHPNDPTGVSDTFLPAGSYHFNRAFVRMNTDIRKRLSGSMELSGGGFYTGSNQSVRGELNFRVQPWGIFSLTARNDHIYLAAPYKRTFLTLVGTKAELSFTNNLYFTTFLQYNTQARNFNINSRLQWRFRPMSDLFVVFSENDQTSSSGFGLRGVKDRTLVVKMQWWLNT